MVNIYNVKVDPAYRDSCIWITALPTTITVFG